RTHSRIAACLLIAAGALAAGGAATAADIEVGDAWSRPTPPGVEVGVAYFTITNHGRNDRLLAASSPVAKRADLHLSRMEGGVMKMRHLDSVEVRAGSPTAFEPNGRHVMLTGLKRQLKRGERFPLVLKFSNAGSVEVQVRVGEAGGGHAMDPSNMKH
ncbi:MAG: copper chaperone PCu(A)C, partial [Burkholderiales bacterium]